MFVKVYNSIIEKKHKTRYKLINAIKETLTSEDSNMELNKLHNEKQTLQKRLSNLIDLKLDDIENKDIYIEKEKENNNRIKVLNEQIEQLEYISQVQKYMNYIDKNTKEISNNNTIGILICKKENQYVIDYCSDKRIFLRKYELV